MTAPQQPEPGKHCEHECCNSSMRVMGRDTTTDEEYVCVKQNCKHDTRQRNVPEGLEAASTDELIGELSKREGVLIVGNYPKGAKLGYLTTKKPTMLIAVVKGEKP